MSASCVTCPNTPLPPCNCAANQQCVRINQSCNSCAQNICQTVSGASTSPSHSTAGATAGGAIGGLAAGVLLVALVWFYWRKNKGHPLLRPHFNGKRSTMKHSRSQSRNLSAHEKGEVNGARAPRPVSKVPDQRDSQLSRRVSVHTDSDQPAEDPFSDHHASRKSFTSTTIRPISMLAYLPPDANSMSVEDGQQRTIAGEKRGAEPLGVIPEGKTVDTVPPSKRSTKSKPNQSKPTPLRPERDPELDLVLPTPPPPLTPATSTAPAATATAPSAPGDGSRFSTSTWATDYNGPRDSRALAETPDDRHTSTASSISLTDSHMSLLVDPPQLIATSSAERVEVVRAQPIMLASPKSKKQVKQSPVAAENPFDDTAMETSHEHCDSAGGSRPLVDDGVARVPRLSAAPTSAPTAAVQADRDRMSHVSVPESSRLSLCPTEITSARVPSTASFSALDGIPFLPSGDRSSVQSDAHADPRFSRLSARSSTADQSRPTSAASFATTAAAWSNEPRSLLVENTGRPTSASTVRASSAAGWSDGPRPESSLSSPDLARRSGFSSGGALSGVPFRLAFPGERDSMATTARMSTWSEMPDLPTARSSMIPGGLPMARKSDVPPLPSPDPSDDQGVPMKPSLPSSASQATLVPTPSQSDTRTSIAASHDARASSASLDLSAQLAAQFVDSI